jgi:hypothetical protein
MTLLPNFLVIGAMKCATTTLHEQLARQPGIFMTTPKEPNFFSDDDVYARGIGWYQSLFAAGAEASLRGESSTHYTKLPTHPHALERIRRHLPNPKLVYVMRHPIDRLVSHYVHEWSEKRIAVPIDEAVERHPALVDYGRYAMQLRPYLEAFGPARVLPVFLERLQAAPQVELARVCAFLGHSGEPRWHEDAARRNTSSERLKKSRMRDTIVKPPLLRALRRRFVPKGVRERVQDLWRMKERPGLSDVRRAWLEQRFDAELAELGGWLGIPLSCRSFAATTADRAFSWSAAVPSSRMVSARVP